MKLRRLIGVKSAKVEGDGSFGNEDCEVSIEGFVEFAIFESFLDCWSYRVTCDLPCCSEGGTSRAI